MNQFKSFFIILCFLLTFSGLFAKDKKDSNFRVYKGAWFEIEYPKTFKVKPSLESNIPNQYDSVYFISPDKKVSFYVYSPQWSGDATDIIINSTTEVLKDQKTETRNGMKYKWYTFENKNGQMFRSFQESSNEEETTKLIIGIEYMNRESYKKYKNSYLKFKNSIKQFAD